MADAEARFVIDIDAGPGKAGAASMSAELSKLKAQIEGDTKALQELVAAAGRLKGSADVQAFERVSKDLARAQNEAGKLADKVKALREAGAATAKIAGTEKLLEASRARVASLGAAQERLSQTQAVKAYKDVTAAIGSKQKALAAAQLQMSQLGGSMRDTDDRAKKFALTMAAVKERVAAVGKWAAIAGTSGIVALAGFAAYAADSARSAQILREAATGSAAGAAALEGRVAGVLAKTAATRAEVEGLALELRRTERFAGELDGALGAITTTTQVMGAQAGGIIKGLAERAVMARRFVLQPLELRGTGIKFEEVAAALGKQMGIATGAAAAALRNGQVKIQDGLKALDAAVETRFGALARKQMLALPAQLARAKDNLLQLFTGVGLETFLRGLQRVLGWLDQSTASGQKLKGILDKVFTPLGNSAMVVFPMILEFLFGLVIGALKVYAAIRPIAAEVLSWFGFSEGTGLEAAFSLGEIAAYALAAAIVYAGGVAVVSGAKMLLGLGPVGILLAEIAVTVALLIELWKTLTKAWEDRDVIWRQVRSDLGLLSDAEREKEIGIVTGEDWLAAHPMESVQVPAPNDTDALKGAQSSGEAIGSGLVSGMQSQMSSVENAGAALASAAETGFNRAAEIHSPSALFRRQARQLPAGAAQGVEDGTPEVSAAVAGMASAEPMQGGAGRAGNVYVNAVFNIGGVDPSKLDKQGILEAFVDILEDAAAQVGLGRVTVTA